MRVVHGIDDAGGQLRVEHRIHREDHGFAGGQAGLGLGPEGGQRHDGVHGVDFPVEFGAFPAGGQRQRREQAEKQRAEPEQKMTFHRYFLYLAVFCQ